MAKIYINNVLQKAEILPADVPTLDETLETFSFALISNTNPLPLAPMQKVKVDFTGDNTDVAYFYIVSDSVETYSLNPLRYKHSISCIQNTRKLSKHLVRNSSFTQPFYLQKASFNTEKRYYRVSNQLDPSHWQDEYGVNTAVLNENSEPLIISSREKLTKAVLKISFQYGSGQYQTSGSGDLYSYDKNVNDITSRFPTYSGAYMVEHFTLRYIDGNGVTQTTSITPSTFGVTGFDFNGEYNFPLIIELANQGCTNFEVLFDTKDMFDYTDAPPSGDWVLWWMMQVSIEVNAYYYNCYDILDLLIKRQQKETSLRYDAPLFALPQSGELYDLLKNTIAPNFTFTQLTMYECVAEVFRLFDAIFTLDENDVLGIDYFNDLSKESVSGGKFAGRTLSLGEDKYTNGLVAYYQDARIVESFPRADGNFAHLRSAEFGVPDAQDHNLIVPHNIDVVLKCEIIVDGFCFKSRGSSGDTGKNYYGTMAVDITHYVLERNAWSTLETGDLTNSDYVNGTLKKTNTIYYVKGDNKIQCGASFKSGWFLNRYVLQNLVDTELVRLAAMGSHDRIKTPDTTILRGDWKAIQMRIKYLSTTDGKAKIHSVTNKYDGETLIDQANGAVDLNKFGLNMLGLSLKLGNPTLNATHKITSWANRIKTGQLYEYQGKLWVANVVNYTFLISILFLLKSGTNCMISDDVLTSVSILIMI